MIWPMLYYKECGLFRQKNIRINSFYFLFILVFFLYRLFLVLSFLAIGFFGRDTDVAFIKFGMTPFTLGDAVAFIICAINGPGLGLDVTFIIFGINGTGLGLDVDFIIFGIKFDGLGADVAFINAGITAGTRCALVLLIIFSILFAEPLDLSLLDTSSARVSNCCDNDDIYTVVAPASAPPVTVTLP